MQYKAIHYQSGKPLQITTDQGKITSVEDTEDTGNMPFVGPPLLDMQVNGYNGLDINNPETTVPEDLKKITEIFLDLGITYWVPTIVTNSQKNITALLKNVRAAIDTYPEVKQSVPGIHVEGPYICAEDGPRGAHDKGSVREPELDEYKEWQEACGGIIRIVTLSPEYESAVEFIKGITADNVIASLGHCMGTRDQIKAAVDAGAALATHLGNGAHPMVHRHNSYIWELLAEDRIWAGLIGDGFHLPQAQFQNFIRAKEVKRVVLTSDVVYLGGCKPGDYTFGDLPVRMKENGKIVLADNEEIMAGASFHLLYSIENAVKLAHRTQAEAWLMASENAASMMMLNTYPSLKKGDDAVFTMYRWEKDNKLNIEQIIDERL